MNPYSLYSLFNHIVGIDIGGGISTQKSCTEEELNCILSSFLRAIDELVYMYQKGRVKDCSMLSKTSHLTVYNHNNDIIVRGSVANTIGCEELLQSKPKIIQYFQRQYPCGIHYESIDPIYLSLFLYKELPFITRTKTGKMHLDEMMLLRRNSAPVPLTESESYKALLAGSPCSIYSPFDSNHVVDSDYQRLSEVLKSIQMNGYPLNDRLITFYNDENYIRDGQHRAAVLKYLYGNKEVPVLRLYLNKETPK